MEYIDGFACYDPDSAKLNDDFEVACFPAYQKYIPANFWYNARSKIISDTIVHSFKLSSRIKFMEIGCGNGFVLKKLKSDHDKIDFHGCDVYVEALRYCRLNNPTVNLFQYNLFKNNLNEKYDCIGLFDVLEHIEQDETALRNINNLLSENGQLILTVPSNMKLWSNNDVVNKHKRRYLAGDLISKLNNNNFEVMYMNHFVCLLFPLLWIKALFQKNKKVELSSLKTKQIAHLLNLKINPALNFIFKLIMNVEIMLIKTGIKFPFGSSIICVARKK